MLQVETTTGSTQYIYGQEATISFWGLPEGDQVNRDLRVVTIEVLGAYRASFGLNVNNSALFEDIGICITEKENEEPEYVPSAVEGYSTLYDINYSAKTPYYSLKGENKDYVWKALAQLQPGKTYYMKPYAVLDQQLLFGSQKAFTMSCTGTFRECMVLEHDACRCQW